MQNPVYHIHLLSILDKYINYNEESEELKKLLNTYLDTTYNSYDNKYNYIDFKDLEEYLKGKINLSYSSMNNYYLCAFRFYIENVLKLDPFTDTFAAFLGNLFHDCLSKMYEDGFDLKSNYEAYLSKKELNAKEKFFCEKLYTNLEFIIRTIRFQEGYSKYNKVLTEKHISVDKSSKLKINFLGFVDKIKYYQGFTNSQNQVKDGTKIYELTNLASTVTDFTEIDIVDRNKNMMNTFIEYLYSNKLMQ